MRLCSQNVFLETGIEVVGPGYVWVPSNPPDKLVKLSNYEHRLFLLLYNNANEVCERDQIVHEVWGGNYLDKVGNQRIDKLVSRLRKRIEPDLSHPPAMKNTRPLQPDLADFVRETPAANASDPPETMQKVECSSLLPILVMS